MVALGRADAVRDHPVRPELGTELGKPDARLSSARSERVVQAGDKASPASASPSYSTQRTATPLPPRVFFQPKWCSVDRKAPGSNATKYFGERESKCILLALEKHGRMHAVGFASAKKKKA